MVFLSNENQPLVLESDDRRFVVIRTPFEMPKDQYTKVGAEIAAGGIAALHDYLLQLDLGDHHPYTEPPATRAKDDLIDLSLESPERFINDWVNGDLGLPVVPAASMDIYKAYQRMCKQYGIRFPREKAHFLAKFKDKRKTLKGWEPKRVRIYDNVKFLGQPTQTRLILPPNEAMQEKDRLQVTEKLSEWATKGVLKFKQALDKQDNGYGHD